MVQGKRILQAISKTQKFLEETQQPDGSWSEETKQKEPTYLQRALVSTSQGLQILAYLSDPKIIPAINKAFHFCLSRELFEKDAVDLWAWKLLALRFFNTALCKKKKTSLSNFIEKQQTRRGCWRSFPSTSNLTNFYALLALKDFGKSKIFERAVNWFRRTKAADEKGWGYDDNAKKSEVTFTANAILSLLISEEDPLDKDLQTAKSFLERRQFKDGGWPSSSHTISKKSTIYATSLAIWSLMRLSKDPFNKHVENGIKFLLKSQSSDGGWPLVPGEKKSRFYTTYYAVRVLSFYAFLKNQLEKIEIKRLKQRLAQPQFLISYLADKFEKVIIDKFGKSIKTHILDSRILGITSKAIARRKEILRILGEQGEKSTAGLIDELKKLPQYEHLSKKSHLTQIKADITYLKSLNVINATQNNTYYTTFSILN